MLKLIFILGVLPFFISQEKTGFHSLYEKEAEYMGINFSKAKFIGSDYFTSGKQLQSEYFSYWNEAVTNHYHNFNLNNALDIDHIINRNSICGNSYSKIDAYSLITDDPYHLRSDQVQECIDELQYEKKDKIGVCLVVESFDYTNELVNIWFTLVDMNNNQIVFQRRLTSFAKKGSGKEFWSNGISNYINNSLANAVKGWK